MKDGYKILALCISEVHNDDIHEMIFPLNECLQEHGWKLCIFNTCTDLYEKSIFDKGESAVFELLEFSFVDALVIYTRKIYDEQCIRRLVNDAAEHSCPVFVVESAQKIPGTIAIDFDEESAFRDLVEHLIVEHHFTKINCIAGFQGNDISDKRVAVFKDVLAKHQIAFRDEQLGYGNFYAEPAIQVLESFLQQPELPEAIVCINDAMAIAVSEYLLKHGIRVPEDMVVTGFDGSVQEKYSLPRITTCRRDMKAFASFLCEALEDWHQHRSDREERYVFPYAFSVAGSCGCGKSSVEQMAQDLRFLFQLKEDESVYNRSVNNMMASLTHLDEPREIYQVLQQYIPTDLFLTLNSDLYVDPEIFQRRKKIFTDQLRSVELKRDRQSAVVRATTPQELIPVWSGVLQSKEPLLVMALHQQEDVYGYVVSLLPVDDYHHFAFCTKRVNRFMLTLHNCVGMHVQRNRLRRSNAQLQDIQDAIIMTFADLVESRDLHTGQHIKRTSAYIKVLVKTMAAQERYKLILTEEMQDVLCKAAPLHDIGKIKVSDIILNKPGRLTDEEFATIQSHAFEGGKIINQSLTNIENMEYLLVAHDMALYHHEKWDGSGYPYHLAGDEIPLCARIMAVVDVFDALTSERVYKPAYSVDKAYAILESSRGTHFDSDILDAFVQAREEIEEVLTELQASV